MHPVGMEPTLPWTRWAWDQVPTLPWTPSAESPPCPRPGRYGTRRPPCPAPLRQRAHPSLHPTNTMPTPGTGQGMRDTHRSRCAAAAGGRWWHRAGSCCAKMPCRCRWLSRWVPAPGPGRGCCPYATHLPPPVAGSEPSPVLPDVPGQGQRCHCMSPHLVLPAQQEVGGHNLVVLLVAQGLLDLLSGVAHTYHHLCGEWGQ